ncbi:hypothetical protein ES703_120525 [subsurface metagenome]
MLGMAQAVSIQGLYVPVRISEEIRARKYLDEEYLEYISKQKDVPAAIVRELTRISRGEIQDAIDIVKKYKYFILLGSPGSGKTTFLKYLALMFSGRMKTNASQVGEPRFPILVSLRDTAEKGSSLMKLIMQQITQARIPKAKLFLERLLVRGHCIVLLDGFDEVRISKHSVVLKQLIEMITKYPDNRYIVPTPCTHIGQP